MNKDVQSSSSNDSTGMEHECPSCGNETTFSAKAGGVGSGNLTCDSCGYMPRKKVRDEIRTLSADADHQEADHDE